MVKKVGVTMNIDKKMQELYGSIKLNGETVFFHYLSQDKDKLELYKKALLEGKITNFDQTTITRLRKLYYGMYSGLMYMYYDPTDFNNIGNKVELLTHVMEDKKFQIVHGDTDSTRNIPFFMYGVQHLDSNSWVEVEEGQKIWVYDPFSLLKIEKNVYYALEHPNIHRVINGIDILNHPGRDRDDYTTFHDGMSFVLFGKVPEMKKNMAHHPYRDILEPEITRFKKDINYDDLYLEWQEVKRNL